MNPALAHLDLAVIAGYLLLIVGLGCYAGLRRRTPGTTSSQEYFLAGRSLGWFMIGVSLFATNISCYHLIGLAQNGFDTGLLNGNFEWMASFTLILLSFFFVPFYFRSGISTLPDFLERRFNHRCRDWLAVLSVVSSIIIHITFSFVAGGVVLEGLFGLDRYTCIAIIAAITGVYTILGGLRAVVWTESIQTVVLLVGAAAVTTACWIKTGGWGAVVAEVAKAGEPERLSMLRPHGDPSGMPWYSILLGYPVLGIWYWCADQTIVQRVLGAKDEQHARTGPLFAGLIKILPVFIFVVPGLFAWVLSRNGGFDISSLPLVDGKPDTKGVYTLMITQLLPHGLIGLVIAALLAGLMSNVAAALNSISTLVSYDLFKRLRPQAEDRQVVLVGRISAGIALLIGIATVWPASQYASIFNGINDVIAHIAPPITCVFLFGVFWGRSSGFAAQWTLWLGSGLGVAVFALNKLVTNNPLHDIPFMMMAFWLFCACAAIMTTLTILVPHQHTAASRDLAWTSPLEPLRQPGWPGLADYRVLGGGLLVLMLILYGVFR